MQFKKIKVDSVQRERLLMWIEALESGRYTQTKSTLRRLHSNEEDDDEPAGMCCLGVACDVYDPKKWSLDMGKGNGEVPYAGEEAYLPGEVCQYYGFEDNNPRLYGVVKRAKYLPSWWDPETGYYRSGTVYKGSRIIAEAAVWNDEQNCTFADIAQMVRDTYDLGEDK